jgi:hypothetical protein
VNYPAVRLGLQGSTDDLSALKCAASDADGDTFFDFADNCPDVANPGQEDIVHPNGIGDACDDPDADGWVDAQDNCPDTPTPWFVPSGDEDCDGFSSSDETYLGTLPTTWCPATPDPGDEDPDAWPPDFDDDQAVNIVDVLALKPVFNTAVPPTSPRYDLSPDGAVNIVDVLAIKPFFGESCGP